MLSGEVAPIFICGVIGVLVGGVMMTEMGWVVVFPEIMLLWWEL